MVHRMIAGVVAFHFELRLVLAARPVLAHEFEIARMYLDDLAGDMTDVGIPANVIADFVGV